MSLLEVTRAMHEQVERLELAVMSTFLQNDPHKEHRIRGMILQITNTTRRLVETYQDKDGAMKDEMDALAGRRHADSSSTNNNNVFREFFRRLEENNNGRHGPVVVDDDQDEFTTPRFTGEEASGRHLDLHELYNIYVNSKFGKIIDYSSYLVDFSETETIPLQLKLSKQYFEYIQKLVQYLVSFLERTQPLKDVDRILSPVNLKEALSALGLNTGGIMPKKHEIVLMEEAKMKILCNLLSEVISNTKANVDRKYTSTYDEIVREQSESDHYEEEDDDDEQQIYNPLKIPMGWDGKPIPLWLYKLHGLGQKFKCEICGDHTYRGRREFERHFKEPRHRAGMKSLGIPNSKSFDEITSINEAKLLWKTIQKKRELKRWRPELEEEYEDEEGNVYNKKTYSELKRQRLI